MLDGQTHGAGQKKLRPPSRYAIAIPSTAPESAGHHDNGTKTSENASFVSKVYHD